MKKFIIPATVTAAIGSIIALLAANRKKKAFANAENC